MGPKIYVSATFDRKRVPNHLAEINNFFHIGLDVLDEMNTAILNSLNASGKNSSTFTLLKSIQVCQSVATKIQVRLEKTHIGAILLEFMNVTSMCAIFELCKRRETQISLICMDLRISQII